MNTESSRLLEAFDKYETFSTDFFKWLQIDTNIKPKEVFAEIVNDKGFGILTYVFAFFCKNRINIRCDNRGMVLYNTTVNTEYNQKIYVIKDKPVLEMLFECILKGMEFYNLPF